MTEPAMQAPINRGALHLRFDLSDISGLVIRTKYLKDLVMNNFLNVCTAICTVLSGIKVIRMCKHMLSDTGCHAKTKIGIDIDLADCTLSCFTKLLFRNTNGILKCAAVVVDDLNILRKYGR